MPGKNIVFIENALKLKVTCKVRHWQISSSSRECDMILLDASLNHTNLWLILYSQVVWECAALRG